MGGNLRPAGTLRIGALARLTGVPRATIQFYLREGLLPPPRKTGRTMAYYDPVCVERILTIKELQRRYLPLSVIRRLLDSRPPKAAAARRRDAGQLAKVAVVADQIRAALEPAERALSAEEVTAQTGIPPETLEAIERLGIVQAAPLGDAVGFAPHHVAVLRAIGKLRASGIGGAAGFQVEQLRIYQDAMSDLLAKEVATFTRTVLEAQTKARHRGRRGPGPQRDVVRLGVAAATGATELLVAIRNRLIADFVTAALPARAAAKAAGPKPGRRTR